MTSRKSKAKAPRILTYRERLSHKLRDGAYRARKQSCEAVTIDLDAAEKHFQDHECYYCGVPLGHGPGEWTLEHLTPLAKKGAHVLSNLAKACGPCNENKHIQDLLDFLANLDLPRDVLGV